MPPWKELPASLDQRVRQLVVQLRRLKDHSGLSLAALAAKTHYSRSSWARYLNGKKLPPREAVEQLARVCGADPTRLLVLHELAAAAWPNATEEDGPEEEESAGTTTHRRAVRRTWVLLGAVAVLSAVLATVLLVTRPWQGEGVRPEAVQGSSQTPFVYVPGRAHPCDVKRQEGELRAGYSTTRTMLMDVNSTGWEILEAQCLLKYHGYDPGIPDGAYGERSKGAAKRFQGDHGLVVDGIVGPDTWKELRR
ncbi:helix-turn-helix domain-containing protein [Streptantibioticus ferralitis]|uniref:Helix-turn-helix domain-containing protein n=1 Tax=Streptantibioticus ferralitis TaxID=236510 RepID=A0ABT5YYS0_9ACTN|nr:helix-turn-helix domain-containing protein [Streptantibioticus ferralitis]MDF2256748.1 helix-turn-helix domain-containing protein [Streptantibioticus ferralitis]